MEYATIITLVLIIILILIIKNNRPVSWKNKGGYLITIPG